MNLFNSASPFWIAETACNHEGDFSYMLQLVASLKESGASAVKFHIMLDLDAYMVSSHPLYTAIEKWVFTEEQWHELFQFSRQIGLKIIGLVDEPRSIEFLKKENIDAYAIHSTCINDLLMLKKLSTIQQPLFIGIGGAIPSEIQYAIEHLSPKENLILMYGIQSYPTPLSSIHLRKIPMYEKRLGLPVGYADHTSSKDAMDRVLAYAIAYGLGARIFEQHITLDLSQKRIDDESAVEAKELQYLITSIKKAVAMCGPEQLLLTKEEKNYARIRKTIVAAKELPPGTIINEDGVSFKRTHTPGDIEPKDLANLMGKKTLRKLRKDDSIHWKDVGDV